MTEEIIHFIISLRVVLQWIRQSYTVLQKDGVWLKRLTLLDVRHYKHYNGELLTCHSSSGCSPMHCSGEY